MPRHRADHCDGGLDWTIRFPVAALRDHLGVVGRPDGSTVRITVERIPFAIAELATEFSGWIDP